MYPVRFTLGPAAAARPSAPARPAAGCAAAADAKGTTAAVMLTARVLTAATPTSWESFRILSPHREFSIEKTSGLPSNLVAGAGGAGMGSAAGFGQADAGVEPAQRCGRVPG